MPEVGLQYIQYKLTKEVNSKKFIKLRISYKVVI